MTAAPEVYGVVGHPVSHSWSPFIHGVFARQTGQSLVYRLHEVPASALRGFLLRFFREGGSGLNVTLPHKPQAAEFANELTPRAARAGAVNTLALQADFRVLGDNTDGAGLVCDLERNLGIVISGQRVLVLGAGGAARGVLGPLLDRGPAELVVANRSAGRARELAAAFEAAGSVRGGGLEEIGTTPFALVINATAASLQGDTPPVDPALVSARTLCYDMAYGQGDTPFIRFARGAGAGRAVQGWGMLVEQAAESFALWRGVRPDTRAVLAALRAKAAAATT